MDKLIKAARWSYALMIIAMAFQQPFYGEFRPVFWPPWISPSPALTIAIYLASAALIGAGIALIIEKKARTVALILGAVLLLCFIGGQLPYEIMVDPYNKHLGVWTNAFKTLALSGGAFVVAGSLPPDGRDLILQKLIPLGKFFFSITMITFGIDHFLYVKGVGALIADWIPAHTFWTCLAGAALIASGVAIITNIQRRLAALLLGYMIFAWVFLLHIPRAVADPFGAQGNEVTSVFEALAFSGVAILIAYGGKKDPGPFAIQ